MFYYYFFTRVYFYNESFCWRTGISLFGLPNYRFYITIYKTIWFFEGRKHNYFSFFYYYFIIDCFEN